jgi:hypothetical protein
MARHRLNWLVHPKFQIRDFCGMEAGAFNTNFTLLQAPEVLGNLFVHSSVDGGSGDSTVCNPLENQLLQNRPVEHGYTSSPS